MRKLPNAVGNMDSVLGRQQRSNDLTLTASWHDQVKTIQQFSPLFTSSFISSLHTQVYKTWWFMNAVKKAHKNHNTVRAIGDHSIHPFLPSLSLALHFCFCYCLSFLFFFNHSSIEFIFILTLVENQTSPTTFLITFRTQNTALIS